MSETSIHSPEAIRGNSAPIQTQKVEISERTLAVIAFALATAACVIAAWAIHDANIAEREARMYEYYTLELDAKLIAAGVKKPEEALSKRMEKHP